MASAVPELSQRLQDTLAAFAAEGVTLAPSEIVWLAELRRPCDHPSDGSIPWIMGAPLKYGGETFWPLHELASCWFSRAYKVVEWSDVGGVACYLYAHTRSAPGDISLRFLTQSEDIRTTVLDWYENAAIHERQLEVLTAELRRLDGNDSCVPDPDEKNDGAARDYPHDNGAQFAAIMCKAFPGATPEYWLTEISSGDARKMLEKIADDAPFATSPERTRAIANYLKAVKTLWGQYG